jgi:lipopolysaccharide export system protein LptA
MRRNIILAVSSLVVLGLLLAVYMVLMGQPAGGRAERPVVQDLTPPAQPTTQPFRVGDAVEMPAGGKIMFRRYDDRTGRPRDMFVCEDWQPVPGAKNEIRVSGPELATLLPTGMIATITADEGQITVDRVEQSQMRPKNGWLAGNVRLVVDRATSLDRTARAERPEDLVTIGVDRLQFDLELGELKTDDRVTVDSDDFEIAGTGLHLIWNQTDNRIETLTIARGEQFVLYAAAGLFGMATKDERGPADAEAAPAAEATKPEPQRGRKSRGRTPAAYTCVLDGGLVAEQFRAGERMGGLQADQVELLFDVGGAAERFLRADKAERPAATRPAREERDRLVLRWNGSLRMGPATPGAPDEPNRRRFAAVGRPVVMTRGDALVRCGQVAFHDDSQRVWLYPTEGGTVEFVMGEKLSATAESVYIDRAARVVKLVGDVELRSRRSSGATTRLSTVRCGYWGELHLAPAASASVPPDAMMTADRLESANFVGDVQVDLGAQQLTAHRLDVGFHPDAGGQTVEELLDTATASGDVRLTSGDGRLECGELKLVFDTTPEGELYPWQMDAVGAVVIARQRASVQGNRVRADLAPPPVNATGRTPLFVIRTLNVLGEAELIDPDNRVAARGREIAAVFEGVNELATATVRGTADELGVVHARPYTVRGGQIDLDRRAQTVHVDGPSRLAFKTRRSLQGQEREKPTPIVVASSQMLHVDGRGNTVRFVGNVLARSEDEALQGDTLTLLMEDVTESPTPAPDSSLRGLWRQARRLLSGAEKPPAPDDLFALRVDGPGERSRKEPLRLVAENALVSSETYAAGDREPVEHASISAPLLEADLVRRNIVTTGMTDLLLTDRRGVRDVEPAREVTGLPSALIGRGPSQTAMRCAGRMTYTLGEEGPGRRDAVVFEDDVVFVHRTGREMVDLERMLPHVAEKPELLDGVRSQSASLDCDRLECWFAVDAADKTPRRGGALTRMPMRLASLMASGNVYLRDQEGPRVREINAAWVEFDREQGRIHVRGADRADARVYLEDTKTGQFDVHAGQQLVINLQDGTIRSDRIVGEMRRP